MLQLLQVVVPVESCGREDLWSSLSRKLRCVLDNWQFLRLRTENTRDVQRNLAMLRFRTLWEEPLIQLLRMLLCRLANQCKLLIHVDSLGDSSFDSYFDAMLHLDPKQSHRPYPDADHALFHANPSCIFLRIILASRSKHKLWAGGVRCRWFPVKAQCSTTIASIPPKQTSALWPPLWGAWGNFTSHLMWPVCIVLCQDGRECSSEECKSYGRWSWRAFPCLNDVLLSNSSRKSLFSK
jgi:hypothetical protein